MFLAGKITALLGPEKVGKSRLLGWLLAHAALGPGHYVAGLNAGIMHPPKKWLYLAGEEEYADVVSRVVGYQRAMGLDPKQYAPPVDVWTCPGLRLDRTSVRIEVERILQEGEYDGLILEPLRRLHGAKEKDNDEMSVMLNDFRKWSSGGRTIVICHHTGKLSEEADLDRIATWARGASDLATLVDGAVMLDRMAWQRRGKYPYAKMKLIRTGRFAPLNPLAFDDHGDDRVPEMYRHAREMLDADDAEDT